MKRLKFLYTTLLVLSSMAAMATEPTNIIVQIDGKSYYKHLVASGDTIYALSKAYGVSEQSIIDCNEALTPSTLKMDSYILIPKVQVESEGVDKEDKKRYIYHTVKQGETIYSIARKYKVPVATLERDNAQIDIERISPNMTIKVRRSERGYATVSDIEKEYSLRADSYKIGDNEYRVKAGETVYSLSRKFGLDEEEFMRLNNITSYNDLKEGMIVKRAQEVKEEVQVEPVKESIEPAVEVVDSVELTLPMPSQTDTLNFNFRVLSPYQTLRASLLLPFHKNGRVNGSMVDFYRGLLLAMDDLKHEGYDIELSVFDTEGSEAGVTRIMQDEPLFYEAQLIIGPVYSEEISVVLHYAAENNIPVISPLADVASLQSGVLFQMQADSDSKYDKFERIFDGSREVVIIHTPSMDREYEAKMREFSAGHTIYELNYEFDRESMFFPRNADGSNGEQIDITEFMHSKTNKIFVVPASDETEVDRVLTTLSSTKASILGRGGVMGDYIVVGNRRWKQISSIDKQTFFNNNTLFLVPYHASRGNDAILQFDARYVSSYGVLPTMYSYRGYDAAMIFCRKMYEGFDEGFDKMLTPLATPYNFSFKDGLHTNRSWIMERYKSNFTIEVE